MLICTGIGNNRGLRYTALLGVRAVRLWTSALINDEIAFLLFANCPGREINIVALALWNENQYARTLGTNNLDKRTLLLGYCRTLVANNESPSALITHRIVSYCHFKT